MLKRDRLLAALASAGNGMTTSDLADWTDSTIDQVKACIGQYRSLFRIVGWTGRPAVALWGPADGKPDAPKPRPLSSRERWRRYYSQRRAEIIARRVVKPAHPFKGLL